MIHAFNESNSSLLSSSSDSLSSVKLLEERKMEFEQAKKMPFLRILLRDKNLP